MSTIRDLVPAPPIAFEWGDSRADEALRFAESESTRISMPLTLFSDRNSNGWWVLNPISQAGRMRGADELWLTVLPANWFT